MVSSQDFDLSDHRYKFNRRRSPEQLASFMGNRIGWLWLGGLAALSTGLLVVQGDQFRSWTSEIVALAFLALLAELWPISLARKSIRITLTLPFVLGVFHLGGAIDAVAVDAGVSLISGCALWYTFRGRIHPQWPFLNVCSASVSSAIAGIASSAIAVEGVPTWQQSVARSLVFVAVYLWTNLGVMSQLHRLDPGRHERTSLWVMLKPSLSLIGLYFLVSLLVVLLIESGLTFWSALTMVPLAVLRHAIQAEAKLRESYYDTITALALMLQRAHPYTHSHMRRVSTIAEEVAIRLGLSSSRAAMVREAAVLHDIGKIAIDEAILDKPGQLTEDEFGHVRRHAEFGERILSPVDDLRPMARWIRSHHERPDGMGYPDQLADVEIPIESKIISVVDAYDAMTGGEGKDPRTYRDPMTSAEALLELERCSGRQFDENVVRVFRQVLSGAKA